MKPAVRRQNWETPWFHIYKVVVHYEWELHQRLLWWDHPPSGILHGWHVATSLPLLETMLDELQQESLAFLFTTPPKRVFLSLSNLWTSRQQRAQLSGRESVLTEQVNKLQAKILSSFVHRLASCGLLWGHAGHAGHTFATMVGLTVCQENTVAQLNVGFLSKKKVLKFTSWIICTIPDEQRAWSMKPVHGCHQVKAIVLALLHLQTCGGAEQTTILHQF